MSPEIPVVDLAKFLSSSPADRAAAVQDVRRALEEVGFLTIAGHGVPPDLIERVSNATLGFFDLPEEEKASCVIPGHPNRGFGAMRSRTVGLTKDPTLKKSLQEGYGFGRMDLGADAYYRGAAAQGRFVPNVFPSRPADFEPAIRDYYAALERLYRTIMRMFAVALDLPEAYFEPMLTHIENTLRLTHYPALDNEPEPGELRAGEHTDGGICTILHIDDTPNSLEVRTRSGKWIFVNRTPGTFVVNIGDLMMRWTNDKWVSTVHRVVNPPFVNGRAERRLSIVTFCQVNHDAVIDCLPNCSGPDNPPLYEPVRSDDFKKKSYAQVYGLPQPAAAE